MKPVRKQNIDIVRVSELQIVKDCCKPMSQFYQDDSSTRGAARKAAIESVDALVYSVMTDVYQSLLENGCNPEIANASLTSVSRLYMSGDLKLRKKPTTRRTTTAGPRATTSSVSAMLQNASMYPTPQSISWEPHPGDANFQFTRQLSLSEGMYPLLDSATSMVVAKVDANGTKELSIADKRDLSRIGLRYA